MNVRREPEEERHEARDRWYLPQLCWAPASPRRRRPIRPGRCGWSSACPRAAAATSSRAIYADKLSQLAGKPVIVENKPGMILSIGADAVAKAPPDGYTILITSVTSSHAANLYNFKKLPYDPIKDFTPVATLQKSYFILMVRAEAPWKNGRGADRGDEDKGRQGELRLRQPAGARLGGALQGPHGLAGGRHPLQDLHGLAAGDVQRRARLPVHRLHRGHAVAARRQAARARGHLRHSACRASIFRPWPRPPTFPNSTSRRCGACCCRLERPRPSSRAWNRGSPRSVKMDATRQFLANTHAAPFPGGAKAPGRFHSEGNQEMGGTGQARENRAAVRPCGSAPRRSRCALINFVVKKFRNTDCHAHRTDGLGRADIGGLRTIIAPVFPF